MAGLRTFALATLLCLYLHHKNVNAGTYFALPGEDVFFNISLTSAPLDNNFISLEKSPDDKLMVFLSRVNPPEIAIGYRDRINYTGNMGQAEMTFWLYKVSMEDAGEFRVVLLGFGKVLGSQTLVVAGRPDIPTIVERTIAHVNKDYVMECKTQSRSRPETNGFQMHFIWKLNDTNLGNNSIHTVSGHILSIHRLQREDCFDKYSCIAYDNPTLPSNASNYFQIDPKYGPSEEMTLDPLNRTYLVVEGYQMRNITCSADCHPDCMFTWDRGMRQGAKLSLGVIDVDKGGNYTCTAQNPITNVSWTASIEVIITTENNCTCQRATCRVEMCSSPTVPTTQTAESGRISCTDESCRNSKPEKDEFPVVVVAAAGAAFACINLGIILACYKSYRIRHMKSSTTITVLHDSNDNFSRRVDQVREDVSNGEDRYSTIDEVCPKQIVPSAETTLKSESVRKKTTVVRYTRQPSVSSRRTSSTADSIVEEEFETPSSDCLHDNVLPEETSGLIYIQPHFSSTED
ncbi:hypothetical protein CHS0354_034322 [Potamilus streckersoni]|uniref:Ig-like domain-containing protein n=1 Tax=Potamilus streckersoni TaxID=2493646 RepID=A0AAE0T321_9BIVA|nr:hypothetical protein CHS0354_034322 [Potamilus streckersoni]